MLDDGTVVPAKDHPDDTVVQGPPPDHEETTLGDLNSTWGGAGYVMKIPADPSDPNSKETFQYVQPTMDDFVKAVDAGVVKGGVMFEKMQGAGICAQIGCKPGPPEPGFQYRELTQQEKEDFANANNGEKAPDRVRELVPGAANGQPWAEAVWNGQQGGKLGHVEPLDLSGGKLALSRPKEERDKGEHQIFKFTRGPRVIPLLSCL